MKTPTNIEVQITPGSDIQASASWQMDGARYHVWFDLRTKEIQKDLSIGRHAARGRILYKNPLVDRRHPDHFETRRLDADAAQNAKIIGLVFKEIEDKNLIAKAKADETEKERKRQEANAEHSRQARVKEAGLRLVKALRLLVDDAPDARHLARRLLRELGEAE